MADRVRGVTAPTRADARRSVDAILLAAREVLAEDSFAGLDEIAAQAGVHRATLYRHFPSRDRLLASLHAAFFDDVDAVIRETDPGAPDLLAEVESLIRRVYEVNLDWRPYAWVPAYARDHNPRRADLGAMMAGLFADAQQRGALRQDMPVRMLLTTWGAAVPFYASRIHEGEFTLDEVVAHTMVLLTPSA